MAIIHEQSAQNGNQWIGMAKEMLTNLSLGAYQNISWDASGRILLGRRDNEGTIPIEALSSGTRDMVFLCLYLGWLRTLDSKYPFPLLLDDPLLTLDPARQLMVLDLLRELGQKRQVILFSHQSYPPREGEHQIRLS